MDLNSPSFVLQPLNNMKSVAIEIRDEEKIDHGNTEFDVDALVDGFND